MISVSAKNQFTSGRDHRPQVRSFSRVMDFLKTQSCAPQRTLKMIDPLEEAYGGSEAARQSATFVLKIQPGLALEILTGKIEPGPAESNLVKPSQT